MSSERSAVNNGAQHLQTSLKLFQFELFSSASLQFTVFMLHGSSPGLSLSVFMRTAVERHGKAIAISCGPHKQEEDRI